MSRRLMEPGRPLLVGGGLALLAASSEIFGVVRQADLTAPVGRFAMMTLALPHLPPLLGGAALMTAGCWTSSSVGARRAAASLCFLVALACLLALPWVLTDAGKLAYAARAEELFRFRGQVIRAHLYLVPGAGLLLWAAWRLVRKNTSSPEAAAR